VVEEELEDVVPIMVTTSGLFILGELPASSEPDAKKLWTPTVTRTDKENCPVIGSDVVELTMATPSERETTVDLPVVPTRRIVVNEVMPSPMTPLSVLGSSNKLMGNGGKYVILRDRGATTYAWVTAASTIFSPGFKCGRVYKKVPSAAAVTPPSAIREPSRLNTTCEPGSESPTMTGIATLVMLSVWLYPLSEDGDRDRV